MQTSYMSGPLSIMKYDSDKHHRKSIRLKNYDYSKNGYYFITICSKDRACIFGELTVGALLACAQNPCTNEMITLSNIGKIIDYHWIHIPNQYENVFLDEYIIMPNHMHGIVVIDSERAQASNALSRTQASSALPRAQASSAPTISQIIRSFKSKSAMEYLKYVKENTLNLSGKIWQCNYYEHIIRDNKELDQIGEYIVHNPYKWDEDDDNPENKENENQSLQPNAYFGG
jgi:putative transposase